MPSSSRLRSTSAAPCATRSPTATRDGTGRTGAAARDVVGIAVAAQQHGLVVLGERGEVLRPAKLWNDTESAGAAADLVATLGPAAWADACGSVPGPSFTITKLAWLARHEPGVFAATRTVLLPHDWLTARLTGRFVTDRGDASGTGWWDPRRSAVRTDLLDLVAADRDWPAMLPEVLAPTACAGLLTDEAAAATGLPAGVPVGAGTGDNMADALGLGLGPGDVAISLGTSGTVFARRDTLEPDPSGAVAGFADATGNYLPLVCTLNATRVTDTVAGWLGYDRETFAAAACDAAPGAGGVVLVPYFDGERTPNLPHATGRLLTLRTGTTREEIARAAHEGVVANLLVAATPLLTAPGRIFLTGGGAHSPAYQRVVADLLGRPVTVPEAEESVAAGAAVQAAAVVTGASLDDVMARWPVGRGSTVAPQPGADGPAVLQRYRAASAQESQ